MKMIAQSINSSNFYAKGYLPLIWKDFFTDMDHLAIYVKEGLPFAHDVPQNWVFLFVFNWLYFIQCILLFILVITIHFFI